MKKKPKRGRPVSNLRVQEIMCEKKCSRQWAYELLRREREVAKGSGFGPMMWHCDDL
jgi:hypothetical protein